MINVFEKAVGTTLTSLGRLGDLLRSGRAESLSDYTRPTRAEPLVFIENGLMHWEHVLDLMQTCNSIWAGYYLQAASIALNHELDTVRILEKLNPSRDPIDAGFQSAARVMFATESYKDRLPDVKRLKLTMEAEGWSKGMDGADTSAMTVGRDTRAAVSDPINLSVGCVLELGVEHNGQKSTVITTVRMLTNPINTDSLLHILSSAAKNVDCKERWHDMRAGGLDYVDDGLLCNDLIDSYMAARMKDDSGFYDEYLSRKRANRWAGILSASPSVATAANVMILSTETASALEGMIGGSLRTPKERARIFKTTGLMLLVVVDRDFEQVTFYTRGMALPARANVSMMKSAGKKGGPDVSEILKAYQLGHAPTF